MTLGLTLPTPIWHYEWMFILNVYTLSTSVNSFTSVAYTLIRHYSYLHLVSMYIYVYCIYIDNEWICPSKPLPTAFDPCFGANS